MSVMDDLSNIIRVAYRFEHAWDICHKYCV